MTFSFHPEAEAEFLDAIEYYESLESSLGYDFAIEVRTAIQRAEAFPLAWPAWTVMCAGPWSTVFLLALCTPKIPTACSFWR